MRSVSLFLILAAAPQVLWAADQFDQYGALTLDERVAKLEKRLSGDTLSEMLTRMEQLQNDVLKMHGEVETLTHDIEILKKQQKDMYLDLEQKLSQAPAPADASGGANKAQAPANDDARQAAYQKAFNILKEGKYADAVKEFKGFLQAYPSGEYVENASYWLAEAYYVTRDFNSSRDTFRKLLKDYPQGAKVADALLKLGYIEYETQQWANSKEILNDLLKRFPDAPAAKLATQRLAKIKQEGH